MASSSHGTASGDLIRVEDGASVAILDARAWPIVVATWFDEPTEALVRRYFEAHAVLLERARSLNEPFILVTDTFATKQPSAKARKLIADLTLAQPDYTARLTVGSIIVIESAILRGVVTALQWILPRIGDSEIVSNIAVALERALALLDRRGIARPSGFSSRSYQRPTRSSGSGAR
ncbi:MAG: hypothetical protein U0414_14970 [Polyangiaceae bacterium]